MLPNLNADFTDSNYHVADYLVSYTGQDSIWNENRYSIFKEGDTIRGGIRVEQEKVWLTFNWQEELLLYDFGAKVGDTIVHGPVYSSFPSSYKISPPLEEWSTESLSYECISIVEGIEEKKGKKVISVMCFFIDPPSSPLGKESYVCIGNDLWQEGVGSLYGFFLSWAGKGPRYTGWGFYSYSYYTMCSKQGDQVLYFDPDIPEKPEYPEIVYSIDEVNTLDLDVFYDKSLRRFFIHSDDSFSGDFFLYDLTGRLCFQITLENDRNFSFSCDLLSGCYLCRIVSKKRCILQKLSYEKVVSLASFVWVYMRCACSNNVSFYFYS